MKNSWVWHSTGEPMVKHIFKSKKCFFVQTKNLEYNPSEMINISFYLANLSTLVNRWKNMLGFSISHFHARSSLNFFIYCFASEGFRSSFKDLVRTRSWWRGRPFKRQPSTTSEITEIWNICAPFFPELVENAWSGFPGQREGHLRTKKFLARTYSTTQAK